MKLRSKKGFSLVELIIVIAILGIIAVIAVPNLTNIQKNSQVNADIRTAESIGKAVRIWLTDSANVTERNTREGAINGYKKLTEINNSIDTYISTAYKPGAKSNTDYYIHLANDVIYVIIADSTPTAIPTAIYKINAGSVQNGLAYQEGKSSLEESI